MCGLIIPAALYNFGAQAAGNIQRAVRAEGIKKDNGRSGGERGDTRGDVALFIKGLDHHRYGHIDSSGTGGATEFQASGEPGGSAAGDSRNSQGRRLRVPVVMLFILPRQPQHAGFAESRAEQLQSDG